MERPKRKRQTKELETVSNEEEEYVPVQQYEEQWLQYSFSEEGSSTIREIDGEYSDEIDSSDDQSERSYLSKNEYMNDNNGFEDLVLEDTYTLENVDTGNTTSCDSSEIQEDYRLIAYVNFVISEGLSEKSVERLDSLMTVLFGESPPYTKKDVMKSLEKVRRSLITETLHYCSKCSSRKNGKKSVCQNCDSSSTNLSECVTFVQCNMEWQIRNLLQNRGIEIIRAHEMIHSKKVFITKTSLSYSTPKGAFRGSLRNGRLDPAVAFNTGSPAISRSMQDSQQSSSSIGEPLQQSIDLLKSLEKSVNGAEIDIMAAGKAVFQAYQHNQPDIPNIILTFVKKNWRRVTVPKMPASLNVYNESSIMMHGYGVLTQMNLMGNNFKNVQIGSTETEEFQKVAGSRINIVGSYKYPSQVPFNGKSIDLKLMPVSNAKAHIRLKNALCFVLRNSCETPVDIKNIQWSFPEDKITRNTNPTPFPTIFYNELKQMFLEYFNLNTDELDTQWIDEYEKLKILDTYNTQQAKKNAFKQLSSARNAYLTKSFHEEFKSAMAEIRHSHYDEITGKWSNRKRGFAKSALHVHNDKKKKNNEGEG